MCAAADGFQHPRGEFKAERRKRLSALGELSRTGLQRQVFRSPFYEPISYISFLLEKSKIRHSDDYSSRIAETFCKKNMLLIV